MDNEVFHKHHNELFTDDELIHFGDVKWGTYENKYLTFATIPELHLINIIDHINNLPTKFNKNFRDNVLNYAVKIRKIPLSKILKGQTPHINAKGQKAILKVDEATQKATLKIIKPTKKKKVTSKKTKKSK